jgi:ADP-heptose:LPS heptosyltransferase
MRASIRGEFLDLPSESDAVLFAANRWLEAQLRSNDDGCPDWLWLHSRWRHQDDPQRRFHLESKRNLLPEQLSSLGLATPPRCTRFFIRLPNWLGDVVMALPLLRALRKARPDAELTLLAPTAFLPLLEKLAVGDRLLAVPPKGPAQRKFFRGLREEYPDTYILFTHSLRGDLGAKATGAPQRFGLTRPGKWRPLLTHAWRVPGDLDESRIHQTRVGEKFFQHFGLKEELDLTPWARITSSQKNSGLSFGLICGTENFPEKRWPVARWRELIQAILAVRADARITLFGTANDVPIAQAVAEGFAPNQVINLAGQTNLVEFAGALGDCAAIVCNDTGGMHLANLFGVPVIAVYGPTNPIRTGPIFDAPRVILQPPGCPPTGGASLDQLPATQVVEALKPWLTRKSS